MPAAEQRPRRVALVTGGARRIGRTIVERLAADGWGVVIGCLRSADEAAALAASLPHARAVVADLATDTGPAQLVREAFDAFGRLDLVVNNAAVYRRAPLAASTAALLDEAWHVNVRAPILIMREYARVCAECAEACSPTSFACGHASVPSEPASGRVVNILDARIATIRADQTAYWLSKRALADATRAAALEFAPHLVVNAIAPGSALRPETPPVGSADSPLKEGADYHDLPPSLRRVAPEGPEGVSSPALPDPAGAAPLGSHPGPAEIADAVAWLAKSRGMTGQILFVDGGLHLGSSQP